MASMAASCGVGDESLLMRQDLKFRVKVDTMRRVNSRRLPRAEVPDAPAKHMARSEHDLAPLRRGLRALRSSASCNCVPDREWRTATCKYPCCVYVPGSVITATVYAWLTHVGSSAGDITRKIHTDKMRYKQWHKASPTKATSSYWPCRKERSMTQTNKQNPMAAPAHSERNTQCMISSHRC
jgi:hypothetical protein